MVYTVVTFMRAKSNDPILLQKLKNKLIEASIEFCKDEGCLSWQPMQSTENEQEFRGVARFTSEAKYYEIHFTNPYREELFRPALGPMLDGGIWSIKVQRYEELDTSKELATML